MNPASENQDEAIIAKKEIVMTTVLSALLGGSFSMLCLLNLPYFYDLDRLSMIRLFLIVLVLFGIAVFFFTRWFVLPYYQSYSDRNNLLLIALLTGIVLAAIVFSSPFYWTVPQVQHVAICYEAANPSEHLDLFEAHDVLSSREYSPQSLGGQKYPIQIAANSCIEGTELALTEINHINVGHGLGITVSEKNNQEHATLKINSSKKSYSLGDQDGIPNTENLSVDADATQPDSFLIDPWGRKWMMLAKWASVIFSSAYVSLVLFGISETIILHTDQYRTHIS